MRQLLILLLSSFALVLAGCEQPSRDAGTDGSKAAGEQGDTSAKLPEIDIPFEKFTLPNGLTVIVHEDRKAPLVAVSVWYHVGSKNEPDGKSGFAHLFEHLMFNGSENHDGEYFEPLEEVGVTDINGTTWLDRTNYFQTVLTPALERALFLESDRMGHLLGAVTQEKLDNQRGVVQNEKRQGENQPYGRTFESIQKGIFPAGHPYHHTTIGSMEDLNAASLEDVKEWFRTYYGPGNSVLVLAGDIDAEEARPLVEKYFGDIEAGPPLTKMQARVPEWTKPTYETMQDRVPQARIYRVWAIPGRTEKTATVLNVAGEILGGGKTSRLYRDLVYERQIATGVSAGVMPFELASLFRIQVDVKDGESVEEVSKRVDELVEQFLAEGPTAEEVSRAQTGIIAGQVRGLEKVGGFGGKAVTLAQSELYAGDPAFFKTQLEWVAQTTRSEIRAAAETWLTDGFYQLDVRPFGEYATQESDLDRTAGLPAVEDTPDLEFPEVRTATLSNGIEIVHAERTAVPVVNVALQFDAGYAADFTTKLGTASLTLAMLDEGTDSLSALAIAERAEALGAQINTGSNLDTSTVRLNSITTELAPSVDLLADIVRNPAFPENELERLRQQRIAQIRQEMSQPVGLALRKLPPVLYGEDHPYGIPFTGSGTIESVQSMTRDDLVAFKNSWLRPDNATIFVVGDVTLEEVTPVLEEAFGDWQAPADTTLPDKNIAGVDDPERTRVLIVDRPGSPQSLILAGHLAPPTGVENNIAIQTMNGILGGQFTARINMNLREEKGWSYGAFTFMQDARGQRPYFVYAPVQTDQTAPSMKEIIAELEAFTGDKPPREDELERVVLNNVRSLPGQFETAGGVLGAMLSNARFGRVLDYQESLPQRYEALTLDTIESAAADVLKPGRLIWMVVGDREKIEESVRALDLGPVIVQEPQTAGDSTSARQPEQSGG